MNEPALVMPAGTMFFSSGVGSLQDPHFCVVQGVIASLVSLALAVVIYGLVRQSGREWRIASAGLAGLTIIAISLRRGVSWDFIDYVIRSRSAPNEHFSYLMAPQPLEAVVCGVLCGTLLGLWAAGRLRFTTTLAWAAAPAVLIPATDAWTLLIPEGWAYAMRLRCSLAVLPCAALAAGAALLPFGLVTMALQRALWRGVLLLWALAATLGVSGYGGDGWASLQARVACLRLFTVRALPVINAIHAFQRDRGHWPENLQALVPPYMKCVPETGLGGFPPYEYRADQKRNTWQIRVDLYWARSSTAAVLYAWPKTCPSMDGMDQPLSARIGDWGYYGH